MKKLKEIYVEEGLTPQALYHRCKMYGINYDHVGKSAYMSESQYEKYKAFRYVMSEGIPLYNFLRDYHVSHKVFEMHRKVMEQKQYLTYIYNRTYIMNAQKCVEICRAYISVSEFARLHNLPYQSVRNFYYRHYKWLLQKGFVPSTEQRLSADVRAMLVLNCDMLVKAIRKEIKK